MPVPTEVLALVERYERNRDAYRSTHYNEAQVRREFIDPFFMALGWDVENRAGYGEAYKDVVHEDLVKVGELAKAPDYSFRAGGTRKFFLEAKKPSIDLRSDPSPAFQLRRYAWSAKLPLSVLTDFEEFAVYDCRVRPEHTDKASTARILYLTYREYEPRWDEIAGVFSKDAVWKGDFDRHAESTRAKRGTAEVDDAFLAEIESWREQLAHNLALRNPSLSPRELNYAVQAIVDRIVFLRIAEDRGIESYGQLDALRNGGDVYARLVQLFHRADERYNSGLFHFHAEKGRPEAPDDLTPALSVDDAVLKAIIRRLYYPESPYAFSVVPADLLGQVYERFLGKVIRLTPAHHAVVEAKPEVRKAGGVYYTPTFIVDYIVAHTVGKLLEGKTPRQAARLRILDPACGSGSFLIGAYQKLLDWHLEWYVQDGPEKHPKELYRGPGGAWRLTGAERKRILTNNIYGVDIDAQAVEVTKLSLLLKVLEGESGETLNTQLRLLQERALPDLGENVKCGNSLIGPEFYAEQQLSFLDEAERYRVNVFDWQAAFPAIMQGGGFDAVIGNPPYIRIQTMKEWAPLEVEFYKRRYVAASKGNYDIYVVFVEKGLSLLNAHGRLGFILPHKFFNAQYGEPLRGLLAKGRHVAEVVHFGDQQVFEGATTYTCILLLDRPGCDRLSVVRVQTLDAWRASGEAISGDVATSSLDSTEWNLAVGQSARLLQKLSVMPIRLGDVADRIYQGPITSADSVYLFSQSRPGPTPRVTEVLSDALGQWVPVETPLLKHVVRSGDVGRYWAKAQALVLFPYEVRERGARLLTQEELQQHYPLGWEYLLSNRRTLQDRERGGFADDAWYRFGRTQNLGLWEHPKLMVPYMISRLACYFDRSDSYYFINVTTGGYGLTARESTGDLPYLCGLLNSRLLDFCLKQISTTFHGGYFAANKQYLERLPIRVVDLDDPADRGRHDRLVTLVEQMLALHRGLSAARTPGDKGALERQIAALDGQIDRLVYELYDLTEDEMRIVEEGTAR